MKVVCNKKDNCSGNKELIDKFNEPCGGSVPHYPDSECGKCPFDSEAKCIEI